MNIVKYNAATNNIYSNLLLQNKLLLLGESVPAGL